MVSCGCLNFNEHALEFERRALLNLITCFVLENFCLSVCVCVLCVLCVAVRSRKMCIQRALTLSRLLIHAACNSPSTAHHHVGTLIIGHHYLSSFSHLVVNYNNSRYSHNC